MMTGNRRKHERIKGNGKHEKKHGKTTMNTRQEIVKEKIDSKLKERGRKSKGTKRKLSKMKGSEKKWGKITWKEMKRNMEIERWE